MVAAIVPLVAGVGLELGLRAASNRLLVYHVFFAIAAIVQAVNWWPTRAVRPDRS
jgi:hypothetical protein